MIPASNALGELPPGIHTATLEEVEAVFAKTPRRRTLFDGLRRAMQNLKATGVRRVFIDGSFVTTKANPNDSHDRPTTPKVDVIDLCQIENVGVTRAPWFGQRLLDNLGPWFIV